jgi:ribosomal protein S18 acetylase RimI-like enzyme
MQRIRRVSVADRPAIVELLTTHWGSPQIVSRGESHDASALPGFVALNQDGDLTGLVTLHPSGGSCQIVTLDALVRGEGIGRTLVEAAIAFAAERNLKRLWLITSNDNVDALAFYQKVGLRLVAIHKNAITEARKVKPQIPMIGLHGISIQDEIELEFIL